MPVTEQNVPVSFEVVLVLALGLPPPCATTKKNKEKAEKFLDRNMCCMEDLLKKFEALWMWVMFAQGMQRRRMCGLPGVEKIALFKAVLALVCQCRY